jgi:hypothetical protein
VACEKEPKSAGATGMDRGEDLRDCGASLVVARKLFLGLFADQQERYAEDGGDLLACALVDRPGDAGEVESEFEVAALSAPPALR